MTTPTNLTIKTFKPSLYVSLTPPGRWYHFQEPVHQPEPTKRLLRLIALYERTGGRSPLRIAARAVGMTVHRARNAIEEVMRYVEAVPDGPQRERAKRRYGL